jgi:subtilase family serine protease
VEDSLYVVVKRSRLSDIRVKEMTIEDRPRLKENYLIEVVIENLNPYSVAENFNVEFRVAGEVVATEENVTIPSGSNTTTVSIEVEAGKTGDALVRVILDSADTVDETNEENNEATQNINIWPTERVEDIDEGVPMYQRVIMIVVAAICLAIVTVTFINRKKK